MRRLYLRVPRQTSSAELVEGLLSDGLPPESIRLFTRQPRRLTRLPVSVRGFRSSPSTVALSSLAGVVIAMLAMLAVLAVSGAGPLAGSILVPSAALVGAIVGAASAWWRRAPPALREMRGEPGREDTVMLVDVPDDRLEQVEDAIKSRHPQVRVQGTDPVGSPPFP